MNAIYISAFLVRYRDYGRILPWLRADGLGAELAVDWKDADFLENLEAAAPDFAQIPVLLHGPFSEMCVPPDGPQAQKQAELLDRTYRLYAMLHAGSVVLHTHLASFPSREQDAARTRVCQALTRWVRQMTAQGMNVTVENVGYPCKGNVLFSQEEFVRLFQALPPETGCLIDIGHAFLNGWDLPGLIKTLGGRIKGYHLHNNDGVHDSHLPIYTPGCFYSPAEMDRLLALIREVTPSAHLVLEYSPQTQAGPESIRQEIRRMQSILSNLREKDTFR